MKYKSETNKSGRNLSLNIEFDRREKQPLTSFLYALPEECRKKLNLGGTQVSCNAEDLWNVVCNPDYADLDLVKCLRYELQAHYPELFGEADPKSEDADLLEKLDYPFIIQENAFHGDVLKAGYHCISCEGPTILEPEDWTPAEWSTLCRLHGLNAATTEYMVIGDHQLEAYLSDDTVMGSESKAGESVDLDEDRDDDHDPLLFIYLKGNILRDALKEADALCLCRLTNDVLSTNAKNFRKLFQRESWKDQPIAQALYYRVARLFPEVFGEPEQPSPEVLAPFADDFMVMS